MVFFSFLYNTFRLLYLMRVAIIAYLPFIVIAVDFSAIRVRWTVEEEAEINKYLGEYLVSQGLPGKKACERAIRCSEEAGGTLRRRNWATIKKKVYNMKKKP